MKKITLAIISALLATNGVALQIGKPITAAALITKPGLLTPGVSAKKTVTLIHFIYTKKEQEVLESNMLNQLPLNKNNVSKNTALPVNINLGMNGVPVLDQGAHGTCVTFATSAVIDAALGKGDYISPLCSLTLGNYLEADGYLPGGWEGSFGPVVLDQMLRFGVVNIENQQTNSCGGLKEYPHHDSTRPTNKMTVDESFKMSEPVNGYVNPVYHLNFFERLTNKHFTDADLVLTQVKTALSKGHRLTIGFNVGDTKGDVCSVGACATYHANLDTWAITPEVSRRKTLGGHEIIVIGYDDEAIAKDQNGNTYQGLLILRNSWGDEVGDHGNFYMTYDYFRKYINEVQEIVT